jgi:uncharacterized protein
MPEVLPTFIYHLDPVRNDVIAASHGVCVCCGRARGFLYVGPAFTTSEEVDDNICPWCIADGSAALKYDVEFADSRSLLKAGITRAVVDQVTKRTPGYFCRQSDNWQSHCKDACTYHGDATVEDIANATRTSVEAWKAEYNMNEDDWNVFADGYQPKSHAAFYKFVCRHCGEVLFSWDLD